MKRAAVLLSLALTCVCASADTIWLKNGASIAANKAVIKGDEVVYIVGTTTYVMPASQVERIEKTQSFGVAVSTVGQNANVPLPPLTAAGSNVSATQDKARKAPPGAGITIPDSAALLKRILIYDHVDDGALGAIESEDNPSTSAAAYAVAAKYEYSNEKDVDRAERYLKRALYFAPESVPLLCWNSSILAEQGNYADAVSSAEYAVKVAPNSADALYALGSVYYATNRLPEAISAWKKSLQIRPNQGLQQYLDKAERELAVEENFTQKESSHFTLLFQGQRTGFTMAGDILHLLEQQYADLARDLNFTPQSSITVVLYTEKEFFDVTQSPAWAGGLNDGKLRIPVKNVSSNTPRFEHILKHELTHSFVHFMTRGQCPGWFNEGLAQMMEPRNPGMYAAGLATLFREGKQVPLHTLEGSFFNFDKSHATVAYAESLIAVDHIRVAYGMGAVRRLLEYFAAGETPEDALRETTRLDYAQLEKEIGANLNSTVQGQ